MTGEYDEPETPPADRDQRRSRFRLVPGAATATASAASRPQVLLRREFKGATAAGAARDRVAGRLPGQVRSVGRATAAGSTPAGTGATGARVLTGPGCNRGKRWGLLWLVTVVAIAVGALLADWLVP